MDRPVKFWEFISIIFSFAVAVATLGYNYGTTVAKLETKVNQHDAILQERDKQYREDKLEQNKTLDQINGKLTDIRVLLQDKQDRKR